MAPRMIGFESQNLNFLCCNGCLTFPKDHKKSTRSRRSPWRDPTFSTQFGEPQSLQRQALIAYIESNFVLELALEQEEAPAAQKILELAEKGRIELAFPTFALSE